MRISPVILTTAALLAFAATGAYAQTSVPVPTPSQPSGKSGGHHGHALENNPSCENIITACKNAGFIVGQWKKDNGEYKDCVDPILGGKPVTQDGKQINVSVNQNDVKNCRKARHNHKMKSAGGASSTPAQSVPSASR